jgi:adenosine deaminase
MRSLAALPKAHLHLHLDGAIRMRTLRELSTRGGAEPPLLPRGKRYPSFDVFMEAITACHDVLSSVAGLRRIVREVVDDAAADGAAWVEVSVWPGLFGGRLGSERDAMRLVLDAGRQAASDTGVDSA